MSFEISWTDDSGTSSTIDFDAELQSSFESPAEVTEHPVESGAAITDHVRPGNDRFTVEAWASNTPIVSRTFGLDGATLATQSLDLGNGQSAQVFQASQQFDRARAIDAQLVALRDAAQLLTVTTHLRETDNCVIESYKVTIDADSGNCLAVSIDFRRIRIATTERTTVAATARTRSQQRNRNRGNQPAQEQASDSFTYQLAHTRYGLL